MTLKSLVVFTCITTMLITGSNGDDCPLNLGELPIWLTKLNTDCCTKMVAALRSNKENCEEKAYGVGECVDAGVVKCINVTEDNSLTTAMHHQALSFVAVADAYISIFCTEKDISTGHLTPSIKLPGCNDGLTRESSNCGTEFAAIFKENRVDLRLCKAFDEMNECQATIIRDYCPDMNETQLNIYVAQRSDMNFFCTEHNKQTNLDDASEDDDDFLGASVDGNGTATSSVLGISVIVLYIDYILCLCLV
ncbi:uncharacterized protein LOC102807354 [Saccoglossus kowalevskii]